MRDREPVAFELDLRSRLRVDQLMEFGWKLLIPAAILNMFMTALGIVTNVFVLVALQIVMLDAPTSISVGMPRDSAPAASPPKAPAAVPIASPTCPNAPPMSPPITLPANIDPVAPRGMNCPTSRIVSSIP